VHPDAVGADGTVMIVIGAIGAAANLAAMLVLRGGASESLNMRGAYLEALGDLVGSIAVVIAGLVIVFTGFVAADAFASIGIALFIVPRAIALLRDVFRVLSDSVPRGTDVELIRSHILELAGVIDVHDVHVWAITSGSHVFTAHVIVEPSVFEQAKAGILLDQLGDCLTEHFDVEHSTFQLEPASHAGHEDQAHR
jgi:cobalt-zinc-cadmium efflux system protein